jgi:hypothetical protein
VHLRTFEYILKKTKEDTYITKVKYLFMEEIKCQITTHVQIESIKIEHNLS